MIKLCIFDLDGTVLDTVQTIAYYGNYALKINGIEEIESSKYKYFAGQGTVNLIENMLNFRNCYTKETHKKVFDDYNAAYDNDTTYKTTIFAGLKEVLDKIRELGIDFAIVSNKPDFAAKTVVKKLYGEDYFVDVIGKREKRPLKPDPTEVLDVISAQGVKKEECLYIGDTAVDMITGKNAGIYTIGVLWGFRDKEELITSGADMVIEKPSELYDYIISKNPSV